MARILDGAAIAAVIKQEVAEEVRVLAELGIGPVELRQLLDGGVVGASVDGPL